MQCEKSQEIMHELLDGSATTIQHQALEQHLEICAECRQQWQTQQALRRAVTGWSVPAAGDDFRQRVYVRLAHQERRHHRNWTLGTAMAASLALFAIVVGLMPAVQSLPVVELAINEAQTVRLAFSSPADFSQVSLSVELPPQVEVVGFPGQRQIQWQTSLKAGENILSLPVIARDRTDAAIVARISHEDRTRSFELPLRAKPQQQGLMPVMHDAA